MNYKIELPTVSDVRRFNEIVQSVEEDVMLIGKDENGNEWNLSAKSILCSILLSARLQNRPHTAHEVDWNTLTCVCERDIYNLIKNFIANTNIEEIQ